MSSTFSPDLRIELIGNGEQSGTWGTTTNNNFEFVLEEAIAKTATVTTTSANQALTIQYGAVSDEARCAALVLDTTTTANYNVYAPPVQKLYVVKNASGDYSCTIYASSVAGNTTAAGAGITIPPSGSVLVRCTGTDMVEQLNYVAGTFGVGGAVTFSSNATLGGARLTATYVQGSGSSTATFTVANNYVAGTTQVYIATTTITSGSPFPSGVYTVVTGGGTAGGPTFTVTATAPATAISGSAVVTDDLITINGAIGAGVIIDGSSTLPALRVTQTGSGNAFQVDDATNPDSTPFVIDNAGQIVTGTTASISGFSAGTIIPRIQELGTDANGTALGLALFNSSTTQIGPSLELARSASTSSIGTFTAVPAGALLGTINFSAADSAKFQPAATIRGVSAAATTTANAPAYLSISTIPALSTTLIERLRINSDGNIIVGAGEASATTTGNTVRGPNRTGTDVAGANFTIAAGNGTGTAGSGSIVLQTAPAGATGTAQIAMVDRVTVSPVGLVSAKYGTMDTTTLPSEAVYRLGTNYVPTASTAQISMLNVGIPVAANTTYEIDMSFVLTKTAGATTHSIWLALDAGSGTISSANYWVNGYYDAATTALTFGPTSASSGNALFGLIQSATATLATPLMGANANNVFQARVTGTITFTTAGTFTPKYLTSSSASVATGVAVGPYTTQAGSYIKIRALSTATTAAINVGGWV